MKNEKISKSIRTKAMARKLILLRTRARLRKFIAEDFPFVEIIKIRLDYYNLPETLNKEYSKTLKDLRDEDSN